MKKPPILVRDVDRQIWRPMSGMSLTINADSIKTHLKTAELEYTNYKCPAHALLEVDRALSTLLNLKARLEADILISYAKAI